MINYKEILYLNSIQIYIKEQKLLGEIEII